MLSPGKHTDRRYALQNRLEIYKSPAKIQDRVADITLLSVRAKQLFARSIGRQKRAAFGQKPELSFEGEVQPFRIS